MADIRGLERRVGALEQTVAAQRVKATGVPHDALRMDELTALIHHLVPVQDGERVRQIQAGTAQVIGPEHPPLTDAEIKAFWAKHGGCWCIEKASATRWVWPKEPIGEWLTPTGEELLPQYQELIEKGWRVLECDDTEACGHSPAVERQLLLATGAYIETEAGHARWGTREEVVRRWLAKEKR